RRGRCPLPPCLRQTARRTRGLVRTHRNEHAGAVAASVSGAGKGHISQVGESEIVTRGCLKDTGRDEIGVIYRWSLRKFSRINPHFLALKAPTRCQPRAT